jgi:hypothetical protein
MKELALPILLLFASGCAWDAGHGFSTIAGASVSASFEPETARSLDGSVLTDLGYVVTPEELSLAIDDVEIETLAGAGQAQTFDPGHPPAGYTLCHGGHCHASDGRLVPYEEVEAELAGGTAAFQSIVSLQVQRELDALAEESVATPLAPSAELPETELRRATVTISAARLHFVASESGLAAEVLEVDADLALSLQPSVGLDFEVSREAPERIRVDVRVGYGARLFDALDFAALGPGAVALDDPEDPLLLQLTSNLAAAEVTATITEE